LCCVCIFVESGSFLPLSSREPEIAVPPVVRKLKFEYLLHPI
jgi:hypothetical protein